MGETSEIDAATSRAACASLARRIESGLGKAAKLDLKLATPDFELLEEAALSALLPAKAFAFGLEAEGAVSLLLIVEDRGALALALGATGADDEARSARLAEDREPDEPETAALESLSAALIAELQAFAGADQGARALDRLADAVWKSGADPLGGGAFLAARARLEIGGESADLFILVTPALAETLPAEPGGTSDGSGLLVWAPRPELAEKVLANAGQGLEPVTDLAELLRRFLAEETSGAVVAVGPGEEHVLATIASLRGFPGCADKSLVVVLEEPSTWNVVRCGRLGLFEVLGPEFGAADFARKLAP